MMVVVGVELTPDVTGSVTDPTLRVLSDTPTPTDWADLMNQFWP
jgi:hypothetical protein